MEIKRQKTNEYISQRSAKAVLPQKEGIQQAPEFIKSQEQQIENTKSRNGLTPAEQNQKSEDLQDFIASQVGSCSAFPRINQ